jgi:uncharacterized protein
VLIHVDKLKRSPRQIVVSEAAINFPALKDVIEQGVVSFDTSIDGTLVAAWAGDVISVTGRLATTVTSLCGRCLTPITAALETQVKLSYASNDDEEPVAPVAEEIELQNEEIGLILFAGSEIDLCPDIAQEVVMALPQQVLCKGSCQGLCPVCGCNLNQERCECEPPIFHSGLAALKGLKLK